MKRGHIISAILTVTALKRRFAAVQLRMLKNALSGFAHKRQLAMLLARLILRSIHKNPVKFLIIPDGYSGRQDFIEDVKAALDIELSDDYTTSQ